MGSSELLAEQAEDRGPRDHSLATALAVRPMPVCCMCSGCRPDLARGSSLAIAASDPANINAFPHQSDESRCRFLLLLLGNLLDDGQAPAPSTNTPSTARPGIRAYLAGHADRLGEDMYRVGSAGGNALNPADECVDSWEGRSVIATASRGMLAARQEHGEFNQRSCYDPQNSGRPSLAPTEGTSPPSGKS